MAGLKGAASLALYALSLHAVASATLAWPDVGGTGVRDLGLHALALAVALLAGEQGAAGLTGGMGGTTRYRLRVGASFAYVGLVALALAAAVGRADPRLLHREAAFFGVLQIAFLLVVDLARSHLGPVANALVLVVLAALRGGAKAAVGVTGYVALLPLFLAFDHAARQLQAYPTAGVDLIGATLRRVVWLTAPVVIPLAAFFVLAPPAPYARIRPGRLIRPDGWEVSAMEDERAVAYRRLVVLALLGGSLVFVVVRTLRHDRGDRRPVQDADALPIERGAEEALPEMAEGRRREHPGTRGRVVRAYLRVLERARETGLRLRPCHTPREIAAGLEGPPGPVARLTDLFVDARYGPDEPAAETALEAEQAAREVLAALRRRRARGRPPSSMMC